MAHASLPKLICTPINTSRMCPSDFTTTLSDVSLTFTIFVYFCYVIFLFYYFAIGVTIGSSKKVTQSTKYYC